jgi:hypothetical protein
MAKQRGMKYYMGLGFLTSELILRNLPFILFLGFIATIYIASAHYAERNVRRIQMMQKEVRDLRWYYMSLQAENMFNSKRSEVTEKVEEEGLQPFREKPKIIVLEE